MGRSLILSFLLMTGLVVLTGCPSHEGLYPPGAGTNALTQYAPINALLLGGYEGDLCLGQLRTYGDFGLGTFNALDGEMVVLDGTIYQVRYDGTVAVMRAETLTPFAQVTYFAPDITFEAAAGLDYAGLQAAISAQLPSANLFHAIRVEGTFSYLKARSVPAQTPPYRPLSEVVAEQAIFEFDNVEGTLVGYYAPAYAGDVNVAGYHCHFLRRDRQAGGHVLALTLGANRVELDTLYTWTVLMPDTEAFLDADLGASDASGEKEGLRREYLIP